MHGTNSAKIVLSWLSCYNIYSTECAKAVGDWNCTFRPIYGSNKGWRDVTWRDVTSHGAARYVMLNSLLLLRHNNFFLRKLPRNFSELNDIESRTLTQFLSVRYITCCTVRTSTQTCCVRADRLYYNWHTHNSCFGHYECSSVYLPLPLPLHESKDAEEAASWDCLK